MALKLRKDIKKSSYYVWFLGAKESKGLRGADFVLPVIKHLEEREKDIEPFKVTLQVSHKGLKIVQNVVSTKGSKPKNETIKHFIPHNTITCVYQKEDIIAVILLLFNPVTKCPLHVHAYRCDSLETATLLKQQLMVLIDRPENQKKFLEIEGRLKVGKKKGDSVGSDGGRSTRESESSEERFTVETARVTTLYDSVAAELREKLNKNKVPILLPPRDYDTVHRQKGNLTGIELRRCLNANIVGQNVKNRRLESSGGSSGIGSDHTPSPDSPDATDRFHAVETHSTSDEDWIGDSSPYFAHPPPPVTLPRPSREKSPDYSKYSKKSLEKPIKSLEKPIRYLDKQKSLEKPFKYFEDDGFEDHIRFTPIPKARQRVPNHDPIIPTPQERFKDAKQKFQSMEKGLEPHKPIKRHESMATPIGRYREEEHRRSSHEIARELKRRSYVNLANHDPEERYHEIAKELKRRSYVNLANGPEEDEEEEEGRYRRSSSEMKRRSYVNLTNSEPEQEEGRYRGYRHSYAEPKLRLERAKRGEVHRTNSVTNCGGRVGIASVQMY